MAPEALGLWRHRTIMNCLCPGPQRPTHILATKRRLVDQLVDQIKLVDQFGRPNWSTKLVAQIGNHFYRFSRLGSWRHENWSTNLVNRFGCRSTNLVDQVGQPICCHNWSTNLVVVGFVFGRPIGRPNRSTNLSWSTNWSTNCGNRTMPPSPRPCHQN